MKKDILFVLQNFNKLTDYEWDLMKKMCDGLVGHPELTNEIIEDTIPEYGLKKIKLISERIRLLK